VVVLRHVLEHLNDYNNLLIKIFESGLKENGLLFIKTPRIDSWEASLFGKYWHGYDLPRHRVHFTKEGIEKLLSGIGYSEIKIKNEVVPYDIVRSIKYYGECGPQKFGKFMAGIFLYCPEFLKVGIAYTVGILLFYKAARMVVIAKRS
jgi:hypothetical protein